MASLFYERVWRKGLPMSITVDYNAGVKFDGVLYRLTIPFYTIESMRVMRIPRWVSAIGVTSPLPFRRRLYIVFGGHSAFRPGKGVLFERSEGFWREVVVAVNDLEKFIESVEKASGRFVIK